MGVVAAARHPKPDDRKTVANGIRAQDADLRTGTLEPAVFKTLQVCGIELKLEPVSPSLGTIVHGLELDKDLEDEQVVSFLRQLWLERRVIMFRGQEHLTRDGLIKFAKHFGELGAHHGERNHVPSAPQTPEGYPDVLPIQSGEKNPAGGV